MIDERFILKPGAIASLGLGQEPERPPPPRRPKEFGLSVPVSAPAPASRPSPWNVALAGDPSELYFCFTGVRYEFRVARPVSKPPTKPWREGRLTTYCQVRVNAAEAERYAQRLLTSPETATVRNGDDSIEYRKGAGFAASVRTHVLEFSASSEDVERFARDILEKLAGT